MYDSDQDILEEQKESEYCMKNMNSKKKIEETKIWVSSSEGKEVLRVNLAKIAKSTRKLAQARKIDIHKMKEPYTR